MEPIKNSENNKLIPKDVVDKMIKDRSVRIAVTRRSHIMFFHFYFSHYVSYETAPFQKEIFHITEDENIQNFVCCAFRGSGKSTIITMSYPLWAILGQQQKKFVLVLCQTKTQAKQHMTNLKRELESNELLRNDLGPFQEDSSDEWGTSSLVFSKLNARITAASSEQSIRGLRHNQYRPDLIIGDDVEDLASAKTREGRAKTYQWLTGEVIPAGDRKTRLVLIGNLLHDDSLLMRLKRDLEEGKIEGVFKEYPLLDKDNNILWPGKYRDLEDIEKEHRKIGNEAAWQREYLLRMMPNEEQVIHREWIRYYNELPHSDTYHHGIIGVDLAISLKETADCTAIVSAFICGYGDDFRVYILPNPTNRRMNFLQAQQQIKDTYNVMQKKFTYNRIVIENVAYQQAAIETLVNEGYPAEGSRATVDKHSRLMTISSLVQSGKILFPMTGTEELIEQILGFGMENRDDLVDAFLIVGFHAIKEDKPAPCVTSMPNIFGGRDVWKIHKQNPTSGIF